MQFTIHNMRQQDSPTPIMALQALVKNIVPTNEQTAVWDRAFQHAARELQIQHHHAKVDCFLIPRPVERKVKFKHFTFGKTSLVGNKKGQITGVMFYVVAQAAPFMIKTFFHETTHVKQLLMEELTMNRRNILWKPYGSKEPAEKWDKREYSFAPWEEQANAFSEKAYTAFLRREVTRQMKDESVHAYHVAAALRFIFPQEDVFRVTQELHRDREERVS